MASFLGGWAQVNVTGASVGNGSYATLGAAFTAINGGAQGGANIVVDIVGNTNEGTASASLNQSASPWASMLIQPSGGAWTITGATTAGNPLINLNGADNVTIDGGNSLTVTNTSTGSTNGTSTIRFINDATNNVITRCSIQGSSTVAITGSGGDILFSTGTTSGNDNNTVSFCDIGPAGTNLPRMGITGNGSTASTTLYNSGNQILNCNIFDYSSAAAASGIYSNSGNTAWTISNNRFYQTASRSSSNTHTAIQFNGGSGNDGSLISNNIIGFASSSGTGTYTFVATGGSGRFWPIYIANASINSANSIQGNTIQNIALSGQANGTGSGAPFAGIFVDNGLANIGTVTGNVIGSTTASNSIAYSSSASTVGDIYGIYFSVLASTNIANNQIGGFVLTQTNNNSISFFGIRATAANTNVLTITGNTVGYAAAPITNNATGSSSRAIGIFSETGASQVSYNDVGYLNVSAPNTGLGNVASVIGIYNDNTSSTAGNLIAHNTVRACNQTNGGSAVSVNGIVYFGANSGSHTVSHNAVHSLTTQSGIGSTQGIFVGAGTATFQNNMVRLGYDATGASLTQGITITGLHEQAGASNFYHNSVYIGGTNVTGTNRTYAFRSLVGTAVREIENNIFFNGRSNDVSGTGKHHAITLGGITPNLTGMVSDYNDLFVSGSGGVVGFYSGVDLVTLSDWQTTTGKDFHSFFQNPNYVNPTGSAATGDLHINNPTPVEAVGIAVAAVTDDVDGQSRAGLTPVDVGADAGNFTFVDQTAPTILHAPGANCTVGDFSFTANITDYTGVPTTGALQPRVYYRKNNGALQSSQGVLTSGTAQNGIWTFTILASTMGGMAVGDFVYYFLIAQDVAGPYIISNPAFGLVASDVNNVTTPPATLYKYGAMGGTYTVGLGGNYTTLTAAVADYNTNCLGGPVLYSLIDATYPSETFPITINANVTSSGTNTLTIKPAAGVSPTISGNNILFLLNGADYVTIDGSNGSIANSICPRDTASRNLTLQTTGSATAQVALCTTAGNNAATNNRVMNCILTGVGISVHIGGPTIGSGTGANGNNFNEIVNNRLDNNLFASGTSSVKAQSNTYSLNLMKGMMTLLYENAPTIHANTLGYRSLSSGDVLGMNLGFNTGAISSSSTTGQEVTNASIQYNKVDLLESLNRESVCGICIAATSTGTTTVANNMVSRIASDPLSPDFGAGIFWGGGAGILQVWYNTVSVRNPSGTFITSIEPMMALGVNGTTPLLDIRNNVLHGNVVFNQNTTSINLGYNSTPGNFLNLTSNYNDLTTTGQAGSCTGRTVSLNSTGTSFASLANWQAATGRDANSIRVLPNFVSASNLHLPDLNNANIVDRAMPIAITTDFDCESRSLSAPDMGADETMHLFCASADAGVATASPTVICGSGTVTLTATGFAVGAGSSYVWQSSPAGLNTWTNTGGTNPATYTTGVIGTATDFRLWAACATNSSIDSSNIVSISVAPVTNPAVGIVASPGSAVCTGGTATFTATATNAGSTPTYQWKLNGANVGTNSSTYTNSSPANGDQVTCVVTSSDPCAVPSSVTSNMIVMTVGDATAPTAVCQNLTVALDALGNGSVTGAAANNGSTDNCTLSGSLTYAVANATFTCNDLGSNLRTLAVTDAAGNTGTCGFTVVVVDTMAPNAVCQNVIAPLDVNGNATVAASMVGSGSTDNCTAANALTFSLSGSNFTCAHIGSNARTLTVTDGSGNTSTCTASIQVTDNLAPVANCQNVTVTLNGVGFASITPAMVLNGPTDNCTPPNALNLTSSTTDFLCTDLGSNTVTVSVTDLQGNSSTCTALVTVIDAMPPLAHCQNITLTLDAFGNGSLTAATINNGSLDNCSITMALSTTNFDCGDVGNNLVTLTLADGSGNTSQCDAFVAVVDATPPVAQCQDITIALNVNGNASILPSAVDGGSSDACGIASLALDISNFDCSDQGPNMVLLTVEDSAGNTATCTAIVTVPSLGTSIAVTADVVDCGFNLSCNGANDGVATVSGAGGCPPITYAWSTGASTASVTGLAAGTYTVTVTDGNGAVVTDTITLVQPPLLQVAVSMVQPSCAGNATGMVDLTPTGGNACHPYTQLWSNGAASEDLTAVLPGTYTVTVTDAQGCTATQVATIGTLPAPVPTFSQVGHQLIATQSWTTYQWLLNGFPLSGANSSVYDILVQGTYTLQVTDTNGCIGTSTTLVVVGIEGAMQGWGVFPNPARGRCYLHTEQPAGEGVAVRITDLYGRSLLDQAFPVSETRMEIDLSKYAAGIYWLEIAAADGGRRVFRLVVE